MIPTLYRGVARQQVGLCEQNLHSFGQSGHRQNLQSVCVADRCLYFCSLPFLSFTPHQTSQYNVQKIASFWRILSPGFLAGKCGPWPYWGLLSSRSPMDVNLLSKSWIRPCVMRKSSRKRSSNCAVNAEQYRTRTDKMSAGTNASESLTYSMSVSDGQ